MRAPRARLAWMAALGALLASCGDDDGTTPGDAGARDRDGRVPDAARVDMDGAPPDDDGGTAPDAEPADDGGMAPDAEPGDDGGGAPDAGPEDADLPPPTDSGPPPPRDGGAVPADFLAFVPAIDAATKTRLQAVLAAGAASGLRPDVFSKIGDSITESGSFGWDFGHGWVEYGRYGALRPTLELFSRVIIDSSEEPLNSWSVHSLCATAGWTTADALGGAPTRVERELDRTRGAFAIVMYGTNDLERLSQSSYVANLTRIVEIAHARSTIVVLSTIPPRLDDPDRAALVAPFNAHVREVAAATGALVLDYEGALAGLPSQGISDDGVHPNVAPGDPGAGDLRDPALAYGYNVRNLLWLLTVDRLQRVLVEDGPPEG